MASSRGLGSCGLLDRAPACGSLTPPLRPQVKTIKGASAKTSVTKFKIRCTRYLYTLRVTDEEKANKLKQSLPPGLPRTDL